jgi:hypothetical protein
MKYIIKDQSPETTWPGGLFGSTVHKMLETYLTKLNEGLSHSQIVKDLNGTFQEFFNAEKKDLKSPKVFKESKEFRMHKDDFFDSGNKAFINVVDFFNKYFKDYEEVEPEKEYKSSWNEDIDTTGIIDIKLKYPDQRIKIVDLKITSEGSNFWWINWNNDPQSHMYDFLVYDNVGVIPETFAYLVYDRALNMLFLKERTLAVNNIETIKQDSYLNTLISTVKDFVDIVTIEPEYAKKCARPKETQCQWCSYKSKCENKWEHQIIKKTKKILKKK